MSATTESPQLTRKDFASSATVRWCPGCGDYSILTAMQMVLPEVGMAKEDIVFISGIGCSSRFPYYMNTYGFHTIHGRAPALASGAKLANPKLQVWVITGDGDALSIGGNHFIHALRRNQDLKIILFNNQIYGLTKGQFSPTSNVGSVTSSTPYGSVDAPLSPLSLASGSEATFIARTADNDIKHMVEVLKAAAEHKGSALVEVLQNCVVFADKVHENYAGRATKSENLLYLRHGEPMRYGRELTKGIVRGAWGLEAKENASDEEVVLHDETEPTGNLGFQLSRLAHPQSPVPVGIFRRVVRPVYHEVVQEQVEQLRVRNQTDLEGLLTSGNTWEVE